MEVLSEITRYAMKTVSDLGLLEALGFDLPSVQTNLRVDLPNEEKFMLPMHQDYASMRVIKPFAFGYRCVRWTRTTAR